MEKILVILDFIDPKPNTELLIYFGTSSERSCDAICRVGSIHPDLIGWDFSTSFSIGIPTYNVRKSFEVEQRYLKICYSTLVAATE